MARPIVSVIISAKNEAERLAACFASLAQQKSRIPFEVILVDNASTDNTYSLAKRLAAKHKNFHVFREKKPGSAAARNHGTKRAKGKVFLFTDADCQLSARWVQEMAAPLLRRQPYPLAAVGGLTLSEFQSAKPNITERYLDQLFAFWEKDRLSAFPAFLPWAPTCNLAVKREVFFSLGGFDEEWRNAAYDVDFCWRLVLCGFVIGHAPKAVAHHLRRASPLALARQMESYAFYNRSLLLTYQRMLKLPKLRSGRERLMSKGRRVVSLLSSTKNFRQASYRGLDLLSLAAEVKGNVRSRLFGPRPNPILASTRRGETPRALEKQLPAGYKHLHAEGWCYWKDAPDLRSEGELILFSPRRNHRFRFNETAWKIWEVKSNRGQSEDAALALGQSADDTEVLRDIDELTLDFRTRRLLP